VPQRHEPAAGGIRPLLAATPECAGHAACLDGVSVRRGRRLVLEDVDLHVPRGSITGLIGPNGAGKSTTFDVLSGVLPPVSGNGQVLGHSLERADRYAGSVSSMTSGSAFNPALSARRSLECLALLAGVPRERVAEALSLVGLQHRADEPVRRFSLGMRQRLSIASAVLSRPSLLLLDEPFNGLDPFAMPAFRNLFIDVSAAGDTALVASHDLHELERICDYFVILAAGRIVFSGDRQALARVSRTRVTARLADRSEVAAARAVLSRHWNVEETAPGELAVSGSDLSPSAVNALLVRAGVAVTQLSTTHDDVSGAVEALAQRDYGSATMAAVQ
jgi:ABC-2 type transport system ATP-binding protein